MMNAFSRSSPTVLGMCLLLIGPAAAQPPSATGESALRPGDWPTERLELVDGRNYQGLIESEDDVWINLIEIRRPPRRATSLVIRPIQRASIARVTRLDPERRAELCRRIDRFINRAQIEAAEIEAVPLQTAQRDGVAHHSYRGKWFLLDATTDEPTTRRIIVRLEQRFTAYRQILPPRVEPERPLRLAVFGSLAEYDAYLASVGLAVGNRAVYLWRDNLVAAGSELGRYAAELGEIEARHQKLRAELNELRRQLPERLRRLGDQLRAQGRTRPQIRDLLSRERRAVQRQIDQKLDAIQAIRRENDRAMDKVAGQMLRRLYHEAFHAYLENYVYSPQTHHVPQWLNEGLAMLFEGSDPGTGTLRLDAPNGLALRQLQSDLKSNDALPLARLLAADAREFLVSADNSTQSSNRYYAHAWGLAYYLTFEKHLVPSEALDEYVGSESEAMRPVVRFERFMGVPIEKVEQTWRDCILGLW